jgi:hypothetical protein
MANEDTNWKGTGKPRDDIRIAWEKLDSKNRPGWAAYVKLCREENDRQKQRSKFESVLQARVGVRITLPQDLENDWLVASKEKGWEPQKVIEAKITGHKSCIYFLLQQEADAISSFFKTWEEGR